MRFQIVFRQPLSPHEVRLRYVAREVPGACYVVYVSLVLRVSNPKVLHGLISLSLSLSLNICIYIYICVMYIMYV